MLMWHHCNVVVFSVGRTVSRCARSWQDCMSASTNTPNSVAFWWVWGSCNDPDVTFCKIKQRNLTMWNNATCLWNLICDDHISMYFTFQQTQASFYEKILSELRPEHEYFRVGFYGQSFPLFLRVSAWYHIPTAHPHVVSSYQVVKLLKDLIALSIAKWHDVILTHCGLVMTYGDIDLDQHWLR